MKRTRSARSDDQASVRCEGCLDCFRMRRQKVDQYELDGSVVEAVCARRKRQRNMLKQDSKLLESSRRVVMW